MGLLNSTQQEYYDGNDYGNYQFVSLKDIINQFMLVYVGEDKIIPKAKRIDVAFHAQRGLAELSFDTLKSCKSQEVTIPPSLQMILPQDYVNYTKISWVSSTGTKHLMYPASKTSNPTTIIQDTDGIPTPFKITAVGDLVSGSNTVELDTEYKNIEVGMIITGPYIPNGTFVEATSNTGGITTVTMDDGNSVAVTPLIANTLLPVGNTDTTLIFSSPANTLVHSSNASNIIDNLSWAIGNAAFDFKITGTAAELTDIKIGMLVSHDNFPVGTTVTNISGATIVVDTIPDNITAVTATEITFISTDPEDSTTWASYKSGFTFKHNKHRLEDHDYEMYNKRYGLDPQYAQGNGSFYIDCVSGKIHFNSNIAGKTVILDYISDSLGTDGEMQVHKFAEEAMYKWISHAILSGKISTPEYQVSRLKKERFAAIRTAKLRLSNLKLEELTQILRGKSKQIKH